MAAPLRASALRQIWALLTPPERRQSIVLLVLMVVGMVLETLGVGLIIPALALLTQPDVSRSYPALRPLMEMAGSQESLIVWGMLALVGVYIVKALFLAFLVSRQMRFAFGMQAALAQRLFNVYLKQPYTFHLQRNSAQLIRNATYEVGLFRNALIAGSFAATEILVLIGLCALLISVEVVGAVAVLGVIGTVAVVSHRLIRGRIARWGEARQHHDGLAIQHLQQGLGGVKEVKLLGREAEFLELYWMHNVASARVGQLQQTLLQLPRLWLELLAVTGLTVLVLSMVFQGRALAAVLPTLGVFGAAAFRLIPSVNRVLAATQTLRYTMPVIDTLYAELTLPSPPDSPARTDGRAFRDAVELDSVTYTYPGGATPALEAVSLSINAGEAVGVIGSSGAGKSTLVDVLLGLLSPDSGRVLVDGRDMRADPRGWQDQVGYVPQSIYLTDDTLRRNVAFGLPAGEIDEDAVWRSIRAAQLEEFVLSLPAGLDTVVGERGVRLSGGQRQRIGIARALYHDPAILVLDEATSSLDAATEAGVMRAVDALHGRKTILIVAHRVSTVERCDRIYRLDAGRVAGEGPASEMLRSQRVAYAGA